MKLHANILELIGNTPLVRVRNMELSQDSAEVWVKLEGQNPSGSVKDRIALYMIEAAEREGLIDAGDESKNIIIEPTSGNTGIGLALVCAVKGYRLILTMSEAMTIERKQTLVAYGAELVETPAAGGMLGAWDEAAKIAKQNPDYFMPLQFENDANPESHRMTTAPEIIDALGGVPDAFVAGVGTGGTITGVGEVMKDKRPDVNIVAVEPSGSPILSGGDAGKHKIPGIGAGFFPGVLNTKIYDDIVTVTDKDAEATMRTLAQTEGILAGMSSGAALWATLKIADKLGKGKRVVTILPDRGERYLSLM